MEHKKAREKNSPLKEGCPIGRGGPEDANRTSPEDTKHDGPEESRPNRISKGYFSMPYNPKLRQRARELRRAGNLVEVLLWNQIKNHQFKGYDFDRQKIIGSYIVDFYCTNRNVVLEIDGSIHAYQLEYDADRDAFLAGIGLNVIHIQAKDVYNNLKDVMTMLENEPSLK